MPAAVFSDFEADGSPLALDAFPGVSLFSDLTCSIMPFEDRVCETQPGSDALDFSVIDCRVDESQGEMSRGCGWLSRLTEVKLKEQKATCKH